MGTISSLNPHRRHFEGQNVDVQQLIAQFAASDTRSNNLS